MRKNYILSFAIMTLISGNLFAQKARAYKEDEPIQKTLSLDNPTTIEAAIAKFGGLYNLEKGYTYEGKKKIEMKRV